MASLPTFIFFGQSNMDGAGSLASVSTTDIARWTGQTSIPIPIDAEVPGINIWQCEMPNTTLVSAAQDVAGTAAAGSTTTTIVKTGATWVVNAAAGKWGIITTGALAGTQFLVASNTADTLTVSTLGSEPDGLDFVVFADGTHSVATYTGEFKKLRFCLPATTTYTYTTGFDYSNYRTFPRPYPGYFSSELKFGPVLEASWQLANELGQDIWVILLAVPSAGVTRNLGQLANPNFSWYVNTVHNDWNPHSTDKLTGSPVYDLFDVLIETIVKGAANSWVTANRSGDTLDVRGIFALTGEGDASNTDRADLAGVAMKQIRDTMRQRIEDAGLSTLQGKRIPFVIGGLKSTSWTYGEEVNDAYQTLAEEELHTGFVDVEDLATNAGDALHFSAASCIEIGRRFATTWRELVKAESIASEDAARRLTLAQLRARVQLRYERTNSSNFLATDVIDAAINDAHEEIYLTIGDQAWFLRPITEVTITAAAGQTFTLPKEIGRPVRIERTDYPGMQVVWKYVGMTDQGACKILMVSDGGTTFDVHHVITPTRLVETGDVSIIPLLYSELVVLLACKRLGESGGNADQVAVWMTEAEKLWKFVKRDCMRYERMRQEELGLPGGPNLQTSWRNYTLGFTGD